ncbi:ABC transporter substrate-binding protein [Virgibacillus sp. AGTR]|uniref:ABC transporter substrate-binding protein n=1 Tax=Virgibacillus sp. AGTR TaxID=2812055 RepID=UPI001963EAD7|nr:ABC transporter substrate-binding protein [Virgibacillus sp. AGTR]MCC2252670.1 ABC transporter substrate-binding protein [Virgibacillus sp. AGTR]QRZ19241.1 ABC transporter substrate-binding protein [Virgibacillus sp. AGTR]
MKRMVLFMTLSLLLIFLAACGESGTNSNESDKDKDSNASAASDMSGEIEFYTSQPDVDAEKLVDAFNQEYPDVKVNIFRSGTEEVISKINAENQAGEVQADVLLVADAVTFEGLKKENMLMNYMSPEAESIPNDFVDPDGMYTGTKIMATGLIVNTDKVSAAPTSWQALTSEDASDQIVMPSPLYSGAAAYNLSVLTRNQAFGWDFYEAVQKNSPMITEGNGAVMENVSSGQKSYGMVVDYLAARAANDGSPIQLVYPEEGVPVITEPVGIMADTDQEEVAKAFVDFILSEEGQKMQAKIGYTPIREGVEPPKGLKSLDEIKVLQAPIEELYESRTSDKEKFDELFSK